MPFILSWDGELPLGRGWTEGGLATSFFGKFASCTTNHILWNSWVISNMFSISFYCFRDSVCPVTEESLTIQKDFQTQPRISITLS